MCLYLASWLRCALEALHASLFPTGPPFIIGVWLMPLYPIWFYVRFGHLYACKELGPLLAPMITASRMARSRTCAHTRWSFCAVLLSRIWDSENAFSWTLVAPVGWSVLVISALFPYNHCLYAATPGPLCARTSGSGRMEACATAWIILTSTLEGGGRKWSQLQWFPTFILVIISKVEYLDASRNSIDQ